MGGLYISSTVEQYAGSCSQTSADGSAPEDLIQAQKDTFEKKTDLLVQMIQRCWQNAISVRFVLFDSWFACDKVISQILAIGYGVICRPKCNRQLSSMWSYPSRGR